MPVTDASEMTKEQLQAAVEVGRTAAALLEMKHGVKGATDMRERLEMELAGLRVRRAELAQGRGIVQSAVNRVMEHGGLDQAVRNIAHTNGTIEQMDEQIRSLEELLAPNAPVLEPTGEAAD